MSVFFLSPHSPSRHLPLLLDFLTSVLHPRLVLCLCLCLLFYYSLRDMYVYALISDGLHLLFFFWFFFGLRFHLPPLSTTPSHFVSWHREKQTRISTSLYCLALNPFVVPPPTHTHTTLPHFILCHLWNNILICNKCAMTLGDFLFVSFLLSFLEVVVLFLLGTSFL